MKRVSQIACLFALGLVMFAGCGGKDPKKDPNFNAESLKNPGAIKMGGDARPENAKAN